MAAPHSHSFSVGGPIVWSNRLVQSSGHLGSYREFNELQHLFDQRVRCSLKYANAYCAQFPTPVLSVVARCVSFVMAGFVGLFLIFTLMDESILLHVRLFDRNLIW